MLQRMSRPRRFPEDGKTTLQRAVELKEYKNLCKGTKPSLSVALESNKTFIEKANCVNISLGANDEMIVNNSEFIRNKDLSSRLDFIEKNPEVNLPADIDIILSVDNFPELVSSTTTNISPLKGAEGVLENSWVDMASKGLKPSILNIVSK
jgi:hypothetical protein